MVCDPRLQPWSPCTLVPPYFHGAFFPTCSPTCTMCCAHLASFPGTCSVVPSEVIRDQGTDIFKVKKSASGEHCIMGRGPGSNLLVLSSVCLGRLLEFCSLSPGTKCFQPGRRLSFEITLLLWAHGKRRVTSPVLSL